MTQAHVPPIVSLTRFGVISCDINMALITAILAAGSDMRK